MWSTIGFEKQKAYFTQLIADERLGHAYLFSGPDAIGKKKFALELYSLVNPALVAKGGASGRQISDDVDLKFLAPKVSEDETKIYIEDIRNAKNFLAYKPLAGPYKAVIIDDAETLTEEGANALLKALEEPPALSLFILVTSKPKLLPMTIASRCQKVVFLPHPPEVMAGVLKKYNLSGDDAGLVSLLAEGRLGWALACLEAGGLKTVKNSLGEFQSVLRKGITERMQYAKEVSDGDNALALVDLWMRWVRAHGKDPAKSRLVLRDLLKLRYLVSQPEFNHRLAIENFLINI